MLTRPRLRRSSSWRSRHRTGPHSESGIRRPPMAARAASAFGASRGSATVSSPFSGPKPSVSRHSRLRTCDFALCSQRLACQPKCLVARVRRGLSPAGPASLPNWPNHAASRHSIRTALTRRRPVRVRRQGPGAVRRAGSFNVTPFFLSQSHSGSAASATIVIRTLSALSRDP